MVHFFALEANAQRKEAAWLKRRLAEADARRESAAAEAAALRSEGGGPREVAAAETS